MNSQENVARLIDGVRAGNRTAFSDLLTAYRPLLIDRVSHFSGSSVPYDELYQDATLALYRAALCYRKEKGVPFGSFARACIGNALVSLCRKQPSPALPIDEVLPFIEGEEGDIADGLITAEEADGMYAAALACLSPYEMRVFLLSIRGYTTRQIACELARSEKSVANAACRMLKKLRTHLH